MSGSDIFRINGAQSAAGIDPIWDRLGIAPQVDAYAAYITESAGQLGLQAAQSSVPIKTGELRQAIELVRSGKDISITVSDAIHVNSSGKTKLTNVQLADELNDNNLYKRSSPSAGVSTLIGSGGVFGVIAAGNPTADWIDEAQNRFGQALQGLK